MEWQPKAEIIHVRSAAMIKLLRSKAQSVARRPRSPLKPKLKDKATRLILILF
jgi:hypothetical protein